MGFTSEMLFSRSDMLPKSSLKMEVLLIICWVNTVSEKYGLFSVMQTATLRFPISRAQNHSAQRTVQSVEQDENVTCCARSRPVIALGEIAKVFPKSNPS